MRAFAAAGKVSINQTALSACIAAYHEAATSCVVNGIQAACHGVLVGSVADDGACTDVAECDRSAGPKVCQKFLDTGDVGRCQTPPRGQEGDPCALSCEVGANCSTTAVSGDSSSPTAFCYEADGLYCRSGYDCTLLVANGGYCTASEACGSDGYCDGETCTALVASGDGCSFGPACGDGFACLEAHCAPAPLANSSACVGYPPYFD